MRPVSIKKISPTELKITWDDGHESPYTLELLRDICPCAGCSGERVLLREYQAPPPNRTAQGRYKLTGIQPIGSYAVQLAWSDGHNTGIYTWEHLLVNCMCDVHAQKR